MPTPRIFVSHSHHDSAFAHQFVGDLRAALGDPDAVWMDESGGFHGGDTWPDKIGAEITARGIFIVVLTPNALAPISHWVPFEMRIALRQHVEEGKLLIPVMLQACEKPETWKDVQHVDCTGYPSTYPAKLAEILAVIRVHQEHAPMGASAPTTDGRLARLTQEINGATSKERWSVVVEKTDLILELYPAALTAELWRRRGHALLAQPQSRPLDALKAFEHALNPTLGAVGADPFDAPTLRFKGLAQAQIGKIDEAIATLEQARKVARDDEVVLQLEALADQYTIAFGHQRLSTAERAIQLALTLAPNDPAWKIRAQQLADARVEAARQVELARQAEAARITQFLTPRLQGLRFTIWSNNGAHVILPPLADVPAGPAPLGGDKDAYNSLPAGMVQLAAYQIGVYPVTVAEYGCALAAKARDVGQPSDWATQQGKLDHPVVSVSWHDAMAYLAWLRQVTGDATWRLPTEAEWEHAARGTDGRIYPWGNTWDQHRANTHVSGEGGTTSVGKYAERGDASPYGCHDMAGNVWEWTSTIYRSSAYQNDSSHENNTDTSSNRVLRGGSWINDPLNARADSRLVNQPENLNYVRGFRAARGVGASSH